MSVFRLATKVFVDKELSVEARSARLAAAARAGVADLISTGRASPNYRRFVDGREGAQEETVNGRDGVILYEFSYIAETVAFALAFLRGRSPRSGSAKKDPRYPNAYRDCFVVAVDGRPIPAASLNPRSIPLNAEIMIYNSQPYSRRVDVQFDGKKSLKFNVPPGLFDDAARAVRARFGNTATAKRLYSVTFPGGYVRKTGQRTDSPALIITPAG